MKWWWLDVAFVALRAGWKWLLAFAGVVGVVVGGLFAVGAFGGSPDSPAPTPASRPVATVVPAPTATLVPAPMPTAAPTPTATPAPAPTAVSTPTPAVPQSLEVPVYLKGANNLGSLEFVLVYEPAVLEVSKVERGSLGPDAMFDFGNRTSGRLWAGLIDPSGINGDGPVAVITFDVVGTDGAESPLVLESVYAFDATTLLDVLIESSAGGFMVEGLPFTSPVLAFPP